MNFSWRAPKMVHRQTVLWTNVGIPEKEMQIARQCAWRQFEPGDGQDNNFQLQSAQAVVEK